MHLNAFQQKLLRGLGRQLSVLNTGNMIEISRMQLKTFSYMITRSIKGGDHAIVVAPIRVRKPEPGQKFEKSKEVAPPVLRLKAKREQDRLE